MFISEMVLELELNRVFLELSGGFRNNCRLIILLSNFLDQFRKAMFILEHVLELELNRVFLELSVG